MPTQEELYTALRNADKAGDTEGAKKIAAYIQSQGSPSAPAPRVAPSPAYEPTLGERISQHALNFGTGALREAGSIGATLMYPVDKATDIIMGDRGPNMAGLITGEQPESRNEQRRRQMTDVLRDDIGAETDSKMFKAGKLAAAIAGTAGAGGAAANVLGRAAPVLAATPTGGKLLAAIASGGFKTGAPAAANALGRAADLGIRTAGGAINGGLSAGLVDPKDTGMGVLVGGALPGTLAGLAKAGGYAGNALYSIVQPFTSAGQERLAGRIINKFAKDGPTVLDNAERVSGSQPTLAEATGNAGIAGLQRNVSELAPNQFATRQAANAAARGKAFDEVAGDVGKLDFFRGERSGVGGELYDQALRTNTGANMTPQIQKQVEQLLKRPSIAEAKKTAERWAAERGEAATGGGSMRGLHDMKTAIDDQISEAVRAGKGGEAKALMATKEKLLNVMETLSPAYREANATYAEMSKPINQMEVLQGLRVTDAKGNMTLARVQNAIDGLERKISGPGTDAAKSLTDTQLGTLRSIRDDLLRQSNLSAGKAAGSNTLQNIATDNMISTMLPGKLGEVIGGKAGGLAGQAGRLLYSGPNESVRNRLVEMMLDPAYAARAMDAAGRPILDGSRVNALRDLTNQAAPVLYRGAPVLSSNR